MWHAYRALPGTVPVDLLTRVLSACSGPDQDDREAVIAFLPGALTAADGGDRAAAWKGLRALLYRYDTPLTDRARVRAILAADGDLPPDPVLHRELYPYAATASALTTRDIDLMLCLSEMDQEDDRADLLDLAPLPLAHLEPDQAELLVTTVPHAWREPAVSILLTPVFGTHPELARRFGPLGGDGRDRLQQAALAHAGAEPVYRQDRPRHRVPVGAEAEAVAEAAVTGFADPGARRGFAPSGQVGYWLGKHLGADPAAVRVALGLAPTFTGTFAELVEVSLACAR